jgi:hypothetical protein
VLAIVILVLARSVCFFLNHPQRLDVGQVGINVFVVGVIIDLL